MICLFSCIKEIFIGQPLISFQGGDCKTRKSAIRDHFTCSLDTKNPETTLLKIPLNTDYQYITFTIRFHQNVNVFTLKRK